jgi:dienelactone hydrolase
MNSPNLRPDILHKNLCGQINQKHQFDKNDIDWSTKLKRKLKKLLGYHNLPKKKCDLNTRTLWSKEHKHGTIKKIIFTSEPNAEVNAYLCLPKNTKPPYTFMITLQGHSTGAHNSIAVEFDDEFKAKKIEGDRDFGIQCIKNGIAALCIEQRSFGERKQANGFTGMCHASSMHALMLGRTLIAERIYDVDRGIDYLKSRGDVNMNSIGVMGNSGGGTTTLFAAALLPRIALAVPSCYFCTFADSILSMHHCTCNFVPDLYSHAEMSDIMGLFAPKPVIIVNGVKDDIFPIEASKSEFKKLQKIYAHANAKKHCHHIIGKQGHRFYGKQTWPLILKEFQKIQNT